MMCSSVMQKHMDKLKRWYDWIIALDGADRIQPAGADYMLVLIMTRQVLEILV